MYNSVAVVTKTKYIDVLNNVQTIKMSQFIQSYNNQSINKKKKTFFNKPKTLRKPKYILIYINKIQTFPLLSTYKFLILDKVNYRFFLIKIKRNRFFTSQHTDMLETILYTFSNTLKI